MKQNNSCIDKGIFRQVFSKYLVAGIGFFGILLVVNVLPFYVALRDTDVAKNTEVLEYRRYTELFEFYPMELLLIVFATFLISGLVFRVLLNKELSVFVHSLPVKRVTIFNTLLLVSILFFTIPILLNTAFMTIIAQSYQPSYMLDVMLFNGYSLAIGLLIIMTMGLSATLAGNTGTQIFIAVFIHVFPISILLLFNGLLQYFVQGVIGINLMNPWLLRLSPVTLIGSSIIPYAPINSPEELIKSQIVSSLLLLLHFVLYSVISHHLMKRRKVENRGWINQIWFRPIVTMAFSLLVGYSFVVLEVLKVIKGNMILNAVIGGFVGLIIGYVLGYYMSYQSFNLSKHYKMFLLSSLLLYGSIGITIIGGSLLFSHIPDIEDVEGLSFTVQDHSISRDYLEERFKYYGYYEPEYEAMFFSEEMAKYQIFSYEYESIEVKEMVLDYFGSLTLYDGLGIDTQKMNTIVVKYTMKDGSNKYRAYKGVVGPDQQGNYDEDMALMTLYDSLYQTEEYITKTNILYRYNQGNIESIEFYDPDKERSLTYNYTYSPEHISQIIEILESELPSNDRAIGTKGERLTIIFHYRIGDDVLQGMAGVENRMDELLALADTKVEE